MRNSNAVEHLPSNLIKYLRIVPWLFCLSTYITCLITQKSICEMDIKDSYKDRLIDMLMFMTITSVFAANAFFFLEKHYATFRRK